MVFPNVSGLTLPGVAALGLLLAACAQERPANSAGTPEPAGKMCGGIAAIACPADQYCGYQPGICGRGDQSGICAKKPEACTMEYDPVCGCDGRTYGNACQAAAKGVSVSSKGACAG